MRKEIKTLFIASCLLVLVSACDSNKTYYIKTETASNVIQDMEIFYRGTKIGAVSDISVKNNYVVLEIEIDKDISINKEADFVMVSKDLFTKAIELKPQKDLTKKDFYSEGDTIIANLKFRDDEAIKLLKKITDDLDDQDTLASGL